MRPRALLPALCCVLGCALGLAACDQQPPSWQLLIRQKILDQYPTYQVTPVPGGKLLVERPGLVSLPVDAEAIAQFCQRGPKDCNYALERMLLELAPHAAPMLR